MAKVGDILEFEKPIHYWHKKDLEQGAKYIVVQYHKKKVFQDTKNWWHVKDLPELDDPQVMLQFRNGCELLGYLKEFQHYKVVGSIND